MTNIGDNLRAQGASFFRATPAKSETAKDEKPGSPTTPKAGNKEDLEKGLDAQAAYGRAQLSKPQQKGFDIGALQAKYGDIGSDTRDGLELLAKNPSLLAAMARTENLDVQNGILHEFKA